MTDKGALSSAVMDMNVQNTQGIGKKRTVMTITLITLAIAAIGLSACNTVRGVAKDVTSAADALDPSNSE